MGRISGGVFQICSRAIRARVAGDLRTGSGTYGWATANKMWMSRKFFLLPGIFPLKIENHFQKISQKILPSVLDLLLARSSASDVYTSASRQRDTQAAMPAPQLCCHKRSWSHVRSMSALPPKADIDERDLGCPVTLTDNGARGRNPARPLTNANYHFGGTLVSGRRRGR